MKTMRMLVATLGMFTFALVGCSSSSGSDKETLPKAATYEPENFEDDTATSVDTTTPADTTDEDRMPVSGSESMDEESTDSELMELEDPDAIDPGMDSDEKLQDEKKDTGTDVGSGGTPPDSNGM
jgi:hypothetical protein